MDRDKDKTLPIMVKPSIGIDILSWSSDKYQSVNNSSKYTNKSTSKDDRDGLDYRPFIYMYCMIMYYNVLCMCYVILTA